MRISRRGASLFAAIAVTIGFASEVWAYSALDCQADKIRAYGDRADCRAKERARGLTGTPPDYGRCDSRLADKLAKADASAAQAGVSCPRFIISPDSTVIDLQTGLMWERKSSSDNAANDDNPNDVDNTYTWFTAMDDFI